MVEVKHEDENEESENQYEHENKENEINCEHENEENEVQYECEVAQYEYEADSIYVYVVDFICEYEADSEDSSIACLLAVDYDNEQHSFDALHHDY